MVKNLFLLVILLMVPVAAEAGGAFSIQDQVFQFLLNQMKSEDPGFCEVWNPDFAANGGRCCGGVLKRSDRAHIRLIGSRSTGGSYCHEMTEDQVEYLARAASGQLGDLLENLWWDAKLKERQSYCSAQDGFLVKGRPVLSSDENRLTVRQAGRCLNFGTDEMAGMLEWVGRQIDAEYWEPENENVRLVVGNISAPRGGRLYRSNGRRMHSSHTSGRDVDLSFLPGKIGTKGARQFFDPRSNWWLLKKIFTNPFACVKVVFVDKRRINAMARIAGRDPDWRAFRPFIRHNRGHRSHFHVRIGEFAGSAGCRSPFEIESLLMDEEEGESQASAE